MDIVEASREENWLMKAKEGKEVFHSPALLGILNFEPYECPTYSKHTDVHTNINKSLSPTFMMTVIRNTAAAT